jgi:hypothetical protein
MQAATQKYAIRKNTLAMNGTLAMSHPLRAPSMSPSLAIIIALDARGGNKLSRRQAVILAVLLNAVGLHCEHMEWVCLEAGSSNGRRRDRQRAGRAFRVRIAPGDVRCRLLPAEHAAPISGGRYAP